MSPTEKKPRIVLHAIFLTCIIAVGFVFLEKDLLVSSTIQASSYIDSLEGVQDLGGKAHYTISDKMPIRKPKRATRRRRASAAQLKALAEMKKDIHYHRAKTTCLNECLGKSQAACEDESPEMIDCLTPLIRSLSRARKKRGHSVPPTK